MGSFNVSIYVLFIRAKDKPETFNAAVFFSENYSIGIVLNRPKVMVTSFYSEGKRGC